jgi:hypothetical protein
MMDNLTTFDSTREALSDLLTDIGNGKLQLPDFQRGWVWDDEHIRSLLASISQSYPIGAVMMLQEGGGTQFKPRAFEGADIPSDTKPERLILDGQQRLTSLFQALRVGRPVVTKDIRGKSITRWYYLDINEALNPNGDREDAIVGIPADRRVTSFRGQVTLDVSTIEKECQAELVPLPAIFNFQRLNEWMMAYVQREPEHMNARLARWNELSQQVFSRFQQYQVPLIVLRKDTPKEAVCQVFEKVNTGGVSLTVFELLTATFAAEGFHLRQDWDKRKAVFDKSTILKGIENTDFLQAVCLLASKARRDAAIQAGISASNAPGITCKRKDILRLTLSEYVRWADAVQAGYGLAAKLVFSQRIFSARDLPYRTQLTPLAAILAELKEKSDHDGVRQKLLRWYWCGVFGELYGGAIETRFAKDLPEVLAWVEGGAEPSTVVDATFSQGRLLTLRTRNSAAYKGLSALLMRNGGEDFRSGQPIDVARYFDEKVDIHHIFPQHWCQKNDVEPQRCDSIINKTPLSATTNRIIGGRAPSKYLVTLESKADIETSRMDEILESHVIDPSSLRADDFDKFFQARAQALLQRIQSATGKSAEQLAGAAEPAEAPPADYEQLDPDELGPPTAMDPDAARFVQEAAALLEDFEAARGPARTAGLTALLDAFDAVQRTGQEHGGR